MVKVIEGEGLEQEKNGSTTEETPVEPQAPTPEPHKDMEEDGLAYLAQYFAQHGAGIGLNPTNKILFGDMMARAVLCVPSMRQSRFIGYQLSKEIPRDYGEKILEGLLGTFALQTDLGKDEGILTKPAVLATYLPEIESIAQALESHKTITSYFSVAMSLKRPRDRAMTALALKSRNYQGVRCDLGTNPIADIREFVTNRMTPTTVELIKVATEYNVTEVKPTIEELKKVLQMYKDAWQL